MPHRYKKQANQFFQSVKIRPFKALREKLKEGYGFSDFKADLMAGIVVGLVAIPLGMALGIASGVAPQQGLYTVIIGGAIVALLGGSRFQVTGPTAAFVVILAPIAKDFGLGGLLVSGLLAGLILILMGVLRLGRLIQFIPYPVTTGFTSGIAVVIGVLQLKDFFGLQLSGLPEKFHEKLFTLLSAGNSFSWPELCVGSTTLLILIVWPKLNKKIPAPLIALSCVTFAVVALEMIYPSLNIISIGDRFSYLADGLIRNGIPQTLPTPNFPWNFVGEGEKAFILNLETIESLIPSAFAIAMLGAIESLLSAVVADGLAQTKHDPDSELIALGIGNILCPFFGGIPATGAIARTTTNIRYGARSPLASFIHAVFTLLVVLLFAPYVSYLPMASLAALLLVVAYNMSERKHFVHILKVAPKSDVVVLLLCFSLTVLFDMVIGVSVGVVLASVLFMQRMSQVTEGTRLVGSDKLDERGKTIPKDLIVYEIAGPLFFGAAEKAAGSISNISENIRGVAFLMSKVPVMDVTGLVAFESGVNKLRKTNKAVYIVGLNSQPRELLRRSGLLEKVDCYLNIEDLLDKIDSK